MSNIQFLQVLEYDREESLVQQYDVHILKAKRR